MIQVTFKADTLRFQSVINLYSSYKHSSTHDYLLFSLHITNLKIVP